MIYLQMPAGANLTENTEYTITVPAGVVKDVTGNVNNIYSLYKFTTLSGTNCYNNYADKWPSTRTFPASMYDKNVNDTVKPTFVSMWPPEGATDVPAAASTS